MMNTYKRPLYRSISNRSKVLIDKHNSNSILYNDVNESKYELRTSEIINQSNDNIDNVQIE